MNIAKFNISLSKIEPVLKEFDIYRMNGTRSINETGVSSAFKLASIKDSYVNTYKVGLSNFDFDFLVIDQSFFQFELQETENKIEFRYAFFQNPIEYITYEEFVRQSIEEDNLGYTIEEVGSSLEDEYDQFLNEQDINLNYNSFRYDLDLSNYKPVIHSASHLHVGHQNNIRIPLNKVISPLRFVLFVVKNIYYQQWKSKYEKNPDYILELLKEAKIHDQIIENSQWTNEEKLELHIN